MFIAFKRRKVGTVQVLGEASRAANLTVPFRRIEIASSVRSSQCPE